MSRRGGTHARGDVANLRVGLAPQRKGIGMLACDLDGGIRSAADKGVDAAGMRGLHLRKSFLDLVIFAVIVERLFAGPFGADDIEEFAGSRVALVLVVERVAVLAQFGSVAAGDDVKRDTAARKLVEGCKCRASSVGAVKPGRCAIMTLSFRVMPRTCWPI